MSPPDWLAWQARLAPLLQPAGRLYAVAMRGREQLYARGCKATWRPPRPCVSVGNIGWGGSGKTPLCQYLLQQALAAGQRPALLTRGYHATPPHYPYLVRPDSPPSAAGDEPLLLAQACPEAHISVDPHRSRAGKWLWRTCQPDLFVLDDGFQHRAVQRDLDLVLLRPEDLGSQWDRVLPAGSWREGRHALRRADAFCIQAPAEQWPELRARFIDRLGALNKPLFSFALFTRGVIQCSTGKRFSAPPEPYLLVSGIAGPHRARRTAEQAFGPPAAHLFYPDHHDFSAANWAAIRETAQAHKAAAVLCTPKDAAKLQRHAEATLFTFDLDLCFGPHCLADQPFAQWVQNQLETSRQ